MDDRELSRFKLDVTSALAGSATGVLLDPEVGAAQAVSEGIIPKNAGLVVALESTGYTGDSQARQAQVIPGWSVEKAKRMGASGIKLLVYYHPDSAAAQEIEDFTLSVGNECEKHDLLFMLEPLSYSLESGQKLSSAEKRRVVVETAGRLSPLKVNVLKSEFPLDSADTHESTWKAACREISDASPIPWILLSAAVDFETYLAQVTAACSAGASGIAVGRAVWQEAVKMAGAERMNFLLTTGRERLTRLSSLCQALARPFTDYYTSNAPLDWYKTY
jgi:tagatose 1,6-diphosphate aldolase